MPNLQIIISALNKASQDINKVKSEIKGVGDSGKEAQGGVKGFGASLTSMMGTAALVTGAVVAVGAAIKQVQDAAKEGAAFQRMEEASGSLASSLDADMGVIMDALREASLGMVSDFDLMQAASRAMMLGVSADSGELAQLMEVAALRGRAMGLSTTQAFNDIVTGIGRASPLILDNLGIVIDAESRYKAYADSIGKTSEELTKAEKTHALLNGVLESSAGLLEETGGLTVDNAGKWEQMSAAQKNYFDNTKSDIADATSWWAEFWTGVFNRGIESQEAMNKAQEYGISLYKETPPAINAVTEETNNLIGSYDRYGRYVSAASDNLGRQRYETDLVKKSNEELNAEIIAYEATIDMTAESLIAQSIAAKQAEEANKNAAAAQQAVTDATNDAESAMRSYSESLLFKIASEGLSADAAYNLAVSMGLVDKNTIAATEQVNVYKQMLDAGQITQAQYNLLIRDLADDIENLPEGKTLEIDDNIDDVLADLAELETWKMKPIPIKLNLDTSAVDNYHPPTMTGTVTYLPVHGMNNAVGGAVQGGQPYTWQEYGYRGELFVPSADGFIMSRADAERALSKALTGANSGDGMDADAVGKAVADALMRAGGSKGGNVYNLTMPTSSNPADVRTAFELMEAWA